MRILVTSAGSETGRLIAEGLGDHDLVLVDDPGRASGEAVASELGHDEETDGLCKGVEAIVLVCEPEGLSDSEAVDHHSRKVYNLLTAASEAGVEQVVLVSSLQLFAASEPDYEIDERWAPPVTPDVGTLRYHIVEFVCREFARANRLDVTCLRMGSLTRAADAREGEVTAADAVRAVKAALDERPTGWTVVHVVAAGGQFVSDQAEKVLGFQPTEGA